jgi:hypothetical protein
MKIKNIINNKKNPIAIKFNFASSRRFVLMYIQLSRDTDLPRPSEPQTN